MSNNPFPNHDSIVNLTVEPTFIRCQKCGKAYLIWERAANHRSDVPDQYQHFPVECGYAHRI